jgi:hypothetical protein
MGKYHPSNYKGPSAVTSPTENLTAPPAAGNPAVITTTMGMQAMLPPTASLNDIKRKLQQYQRDMVEQAALAARLSVPGREPLSPRLCPLGSPGPVTPWELEESDGGYLGKGKSEKGVVVEAIIEREASGEMETPTPKTS